MNPPDVNAAIDAAERRIVKAVTSAEASIRRAIESATTDAELRDLQRYVRIGAQKVDALSTKTTAQATSQETLNSARLEALENNQALTTARLENIEARLSALEK